MSHPIPPEAFQKALSLIDAANAQDPNLDGGAPKELRYGERMSDMLSRYAPEADATLQLAVRAQHMERWRVPRSSYPMDKSGYHRWRIGLYGFHASRTRELLLAAGVPADEAERAAAAVGKRNLQTSSDTQCVEDVAGLVFIEHYMADFAAQKAEYSEEKWIGIIAKTWQKLSPEAHAFALSGKLNLPDHLLPLIQKAIATTA